MRAAAFLKDEYISKIASLIEECPNKQFSRATWKNSLKYNMLHNPMIRINIISGSEFEVYIPIGNDRMINCEEIYSCLISDFVCNARRIKAQYSATDRLKNDLGNAAPWLLVSNYYTAFYSAVELLRLNNQIALGFDQEDLQELHLKLDSNSASYGDFISSGARNFSGEIKDDSIYFKSNGEKPHSHAWKITAKKLRDILKQKGWPELKNFIDFAEGKNGWITPSALRNNWNYKRADLYSSNGRSLCKDMILHFGCFKKATSWLEKATPYSEAAYCTALSGMTEFLSVPIIEAYSQLFKSNLLE